MKFAVTSFLIVSLLVPLRICLAESPLDEGVYTEIRPEDISDDLRLWAKDTKMQLERELKMIQKLSTTERKERLLSVIQSAIDDAQGLRDLLLMRFKLNRANYLAKIFETHSDDFVLDYILVPAAKQAMDLYEQADRPFLESATRQEPNELLLIPPYAAFTKADISQMLLLSELHQDITQRFEILRYAIIWVARDMLQSQKLRREPQNAGLITQLEALYLEMEAITPDAITPGLNSRLRDALEETRNKMLTEETKIKFLTLPQAISPEEGARLLQESFQRIQSHAAHQNNHTDLSPSLWERSTIWASRSFFHIQEIPESGHDYYDERFVLKGISWFQIGYGFIKQESFNKEEKNTHAAPHLRMRVFTSGDGYIGTRVKGIDFNIDQGNQENSRIRLDVLSIQAPKVTLFSDKLHLGPSFQLLSYEEDGSYQLETLRLLEVGFTATIGELKNEDTSHQLHLNAYYTPFGHAELMSSDLLTPSNEFITYYEAQTGKSLTPTDIKSLIETRRKLKKSLRFEAVCQTTWDTSAWRGKTNDVECGVYYLDQDYENVSEDIPSPYSQLSKASGKQWGLYGNLFLNFEDDRDFSVHVGYQIDAKDLNKNFMDIFDPETARTMTETSDTLYLNLMFRF